MIFKIIDIFVNMLVKTRKDETTTYRMQFVLSKFLFKTLHKSNSFEGFLIYLMSVGILKKKYTHVWLFIRCYCRF